MDILWPPNPEATRRLPNKFPRHENCFGSNSAADKCGIDRPPGIENSRRTLRYSSRRTGRQTTQDSPPTRISALDPPDTAPPSGLRRRPPRQPPNPKVELCPADRAPK